ncbi:hypothetical protein [Streptomyces marianii]|nr:hypothetical protein [Streptomyces marianii]
MAATGGSGRSTVARLLAAEFATAGPTVVLDTAPRLSSPWPALTVDQGAGGLAALPPDQPLTRSQVHQAAARQTARNDDWHVLTDGRDWHAPPLNLPEQPAAWYQLAAVGGWSAVIADTVHPLAHDILEARCVGRPGQTRAWCELPYAVPVLCAAATASGVEALQQAAMVLHAEGLPLQRAVAVLVGTTDGRPAPVVRAAATMLAPRIAEVTHLPYDPHIRAHGLRSATKLRARTQQAAAHIAGAVLAAAHRAWGDPLPHAPQPAPIAVVHSP